MTEPQVITYRGNEAMIIIEIVPSDTTPDMYKGSLYLGTERDTKDTAPWSYKCSGTLECVRGKIFTRLQQIAEKGKASS